MSTARPPAAVRDLDPIAVEAVLRRLGRQVEPPWLHAEVARRMSERLRIVKLQPASIVDWWGHTGASARLLAQAYPKARRVVVEPSAALLERSRAASTVPWWTMRRWSGGVDVRRDDPQPGAAQLVWANMMLHAVADPPALMARWQRVLAVDGFVMFSCLGPGSLRELCELYRERGWAAPAPAFVDMHDLGDMLIQAGFADPVMDQELLTLTWDSPRALLAELRGLGGNASPARWPALRTPRWREQLHKALATLADADGRLGLRFEIVYGHAFKAAPRALPAGQTRINLEHLRSRLRPGNGLRE